MADPGRGCLPHAREAPPFTLSAEQRGKITVLRASGDLDLSGKARFAQALAAVDPRRTSRLVIDLGEVTFIDSTGIGMVLEAWSKARRERLQFAVVVGNASARSAFEAAGLTDVLPTTES
jgi:anti-sigma B factor antagonist